MQRPWGVKESSGSGEIKTENGERHRHRPCRAQGWAWTVLWNTAPPYPMLSPCGLISCSRSWTLQVSSLASKKLLPTFKKTAMIFLPCRNPAALHHCSPWRMQSSTASEGTQRLTGPALTIFPAPSPVQLELQICRSTLGSRDPSGSQNCDSIIEKSTYAFLPSTPLKGSKRA